jgi:hypothetical protein
VLGVEGALQVGCYVFPAQLFQKFS